MLQARMRVHARTHKHTHTHTHTHTLFLSLSLSLSLPLPPSLSPSLSCSQVLGPRTYLRLSHWNKMDFVVVVFGLLDLIPSADVGASWISSLRLLRVLRVLRTGL